MVTPRIIKAGPRMILNSAPHNIKGLVVFMQHETLQQLNVTNYPLRKASKFRLVRAAVTAHGKFQQATD